MSDMSIYPDAPPTAPPSAPPTDPASSAPAPPPPAPPSGAAARSNHRNGRTIIGIVLLVLAGLSATFGFASYWAEHEILDTATWVSTSRAIVDDPTVQRDVAHSIADQIVASVGVENFVQNTLPAPFNRFSGALADQATNLLTSATEKVVATDAFTKIWADAVRAVHDEFVHAVDGSSSITSIGKEGLYLQVGPALDQVRAQLSKSGVPLLDKIDLSKIDVRVLLVDAPGLERVRTWVRILRVTSIVLPALAVISLVVGLVIARRRSLAILAGGVGVLLGVVGVYITMQVQKSRAIDQISGGLLGRPSAKVIADQVASGLDHALVIATIIGIGVIIAGAVAFVMGRGVEDDIADAMETSISGSDTGAPTPTP